MKEGKCRQIIKGIIKHKNHISISEPDGNFMFCELTISKIKSFVFY